MADQEIAGPTYDAYWIDQSGRIIVAVASTNVLHLGGGITIDYSVQPPKVTLAGIPPDRAARMFWNAVHAVVGRELMFVVEDEEPPPPVVGFG